MCLDELEARMRAVSEQFDKSIKRKAKGPEFINFTKPGEYTIRVLPSRNYPTDVQWFRKLDCHFIKPAKTGTDGPDGVLEDVAAGKIGKGSAKSNTKYLINVITLDKSRIVQTAKVPQRFIKFLRTFQDMVNMLFCDPTHGNLITFEVFRAANGFGNDYKIIRHHPWSTNFSRKRIPDLDVLLKAAIDHIKPISAFTGNLAAPLAGVTPATNAFDVSAQPVANVSAPGGFGAAAPAPVAAPTPIRGISDADAERLKAQLLAMVGQGSARAKARTLRPVRP